MATQLGEVLSDCFDVDDALVDDRDQFVAAHSMRAAAADAAVPDVWIFRDGGIVSIAWNDIMDGEISFMLSRDEKDVPAVDFAQAVRGFVEWVCGLLKERCAKEAQADIELFTQWLENFKH